MRDALANIETIDREEGSRYPESKRRILELVPAGGCWVDLPENLQKEYLELHTTQVVAKEELHEDYQ